MPLPTFSKFKFFCVNFRILQVEKRKNITHLRFMSNYRATYTHLYCTFELSSEHPLHHLLCHSQTALRIFARLHHIIYQIVRVIFFSFGDIKSLLFQQVQSLLSRVLWLLCRLIVSNAFIDITRHFLHSPLIVL